MTSWVFDGLPERARTTALVVHESVTRSKDVTVRVLLRRGLSVHGIVDERGDVTQCAPFGARCAHAGARLNARSIAYEVVSPYYPRHMRKPWSDVIEARWAHERQYVLPTRESAEGVVRVVESAWALGVPRAWPGLRDGAFAMSRMRVPPNEGVLAHTYSGHADGAFLVLYAWMRLELALDEARAWHEAVSCASRAGATADVRHLIV